ncbi:Hypothetical protein, putative [Bodo saltans]|uniref:UVR domain-containing protein n=1 Tax=Bodo saltans TaxID=75058 RepID=A0A0S4ILQ6_BODSA|nr:Hypothetical protein, putative [Bodo saltans]|eukprot:CUE71634.1 Hypothetical protein, putative [Bodo saltans]
MVERLELCAVFSSSEEKHFPAAETARQGHMVSRGWHSEANCSYPQVIGFRFAFGEVNIDRIQILSNDWKVSSRIEIHVASPESINLTSGPYGDRVPVPFHAALFRNYGYFTFRNDQSPSSSISLSEQPAQSRNTVCGELKVVKVEAPALYVKLVCHEPHPHPLNVYQQVGLISVVALGTPHRLVLPLPTAAHVVAAANQVASGTSNEAAVMQYLRGGAQRDVLSDQQVLQKIEELEQAKIRTIAVEDFESARRIRDQLAELLPLGTALNDIEHRKRKCIAEEDYNEAHRLKQIITRIRTYIGGLQPGMPYQRLDLDSVINASLHEVYTVSKEESAPRRTGSEVSSPHRAFVKHTQSFDEIAVGGRSGIISPIPSFSEGAPSPPPDEEGPLLLKDVEEGERALAEEIRRCLPQGTENLHPEHVGDARAADINGWKRILGILGYYLCCCLFSRKFQLREAGFEFIRKTLHEEDSSQNGAGDHDVLVLRHLGLKLNTKAKPHELAMALLYVLSISSGGVGDTIPTVMFPASDVCQELFSSGKCLKAQTQDTALVSDLILRIIKSLVARLGDSNARVRTVVEETLLTIIRSQQPFSGVDPVANAILKTRPKFAKHAQECVKILGRMIELSPIPPPASLNIQTVFQQFLKPLVTHANPAVRDASLSLVSMCIGRFGESDKDVKSVLGSLKPAQAKIVKEKQQGQKKPSAGKQAAVISDEELMSLKPLGGTILESTPKRRTIEETQKMFPDSADIYNFKSTKDQTRRLKLQPGDFQRNNVSSPELETATAVAVPQKPSVIKKRLNDAADAAQLTQTNSSAPPSPMPNRISSMSPGLKGALHSSPPKRRKPPEPIPGQCQFCGDTDEAFTSKEKLVAHFFSDCPMLCTCPLCTLPVEIREVHWHLSEDCQFKEKVKRCERCLECVRVEAYAAHVAAATCIPYVHAQLSCPLCHEQLLADDIFWEAHVLYPPFCPQNPRTQVRDDTDATDTEQDSDSDLP